MAEKKPCNFALNLYIREVEIHGLVAQSVEHRTLNPLVEGSTPSQPTISLVDPLLSDFLLQKKTQAEVY